MIVCQSYQTKYGAKFSRRLARANLMDQQRDLKAKGDAGMYLSWIGKLNSVLVDDTAKVHQQALSEVSPVS